MVSPNFLADFLEYLPELYLGKGITMGIRRVDFPLRAQERLAENRSVFEKS